MHTLPWFQEIENNESLKQHWWEYFRYDTKDTTRETYTIIMPPPNVTGSLHLGHALSSTQQDILIRFHKALGKNVLWLPGTDHAGIATQMMVEKALEKQGKSRSLMERDTFLHHMWQWKEEYQERILYQMKRMGFAADWSQLTFTLDESVSYATREAFVRLYQRGKIYKAKRLVSWDPVLRTALSDLEVENVQESGTLWTISYNVEGGGTIHVATTRPETLLGDTGIAVHPQDERYAGYVGRRAQVPLVDRWVPIIADEAIDLEKGTGAVKLTPAHDFLDFAIAQRHNLPCIDIFDEGGHLNHNTPFPFRNLERLSARHLILDQLGEKLICESSVHHSVPRSQRSGSIIEPRLTEQWFLDTTDMAKRALAEVKSGACEFFPKDWEKTYEEWLSHIQPWCISRQLWWGHQIPAWYDTKGNVFVAHTKKEAELLAEAQGSTEPLTQDEDVLDTWFSSGLWPFSTLGWPREDSPLFRACYPTRVLVTGFDIIFFWVARMMMLGLELTDLSPFKQVCIHPLICDEKRKKMSKTKGNVIDPMEVADQYGVDALRFALALVATPSAYTTFGIKHVEQARNFMTKLWNVGRFSELHHIKGRFDLPQTVLEDMNRWVIRQTIALEEEVKKALHSYSFHEAASCIYTQVWSVICDWYVEWVKDSLRHESHSEEVRHIMGWVLNKTLIILHPFIPFVTQALWEMLNPKNKEGVWQQDWPCFAPELSLFVPPIERLQELISTIRRIRAEFTIPSNQCIEVHIYTMLDRKLLCSHKNFIERITQTACTVYETSPPERSQGFSVHLNTLTVIFRLQDMLDMKKELNRLQQQCIKIQTEIYEWEQRLGCQGFRKKAAPHVVRELEERCNQKKEILKRIEQDLTMVNSAHHAP
ncbi:valine--tRNA ligase [Holospora curviuscula]|uniref:Valine--tRNA ligase n=1 Tax=Holospora curviuscula TaxID=1082868 RepID=A0A2S5RA42_9PROT|nr:valine--tRNA ligase [Holospora curviuscula]PPE04178.1 Valine--tRNA ligase [Holospora curviuscula]